MDAGKENPTAAEGQGGGTRRPVPDNPAGGDRAESNTDPNRVKTTTGHWPDRLLNSHLWVDEGLQKAEATVLAKLERAREVEREQWSSDDSDATPPVPKAEEAPSRRSSWAPNTRNS